MLDGAYRGDRVAGRKTATQSGCNQQVTRQDVGVIRDIRQLQPVDRAAADGDGAQAIAINLYGNCM